MALTRRFGTYGRKGMLVTLDGADVVLLVELGPRAVISSRTPASAGVAAVVAAAFASKLAASIDADTRARLRGEALCLVGQVLA